MLLKLPLYGVPPLPRLLAPAPDGALLAKLLMDSWKLMAAAPPPSWFERRFAPSREHAASVVAAAAAVSRACIAQCTKTEEPS